MLRQHFPQRKIHVCFIVRQLRHRRRRRWNGLPSTRRTTQYPRFTGLVRSPGAFWVRNTAIGSNPPRPYCEALSTRTHVSGVPATTGIP